MSLASQIAACAALTVTILAVTVLWWLRRGFDVGPSGRASAVAWSVTALAVPAVWAALLGWYVAHLWVLLLPFVWIAVGATNVVEQRRARARDLELGAIARPVMWSPWLVGVVTWAVAVVVMVATLTVWALVTGGMTTGTVTSVGCAAALAPLTLAPAQKVRQLVAGGGLPLVATVCGDRRIGVAVATAGALTLVGCVAMTAGFDDPGAGTVSATLMAFLPAWVLLGAAWVLLRPCGPTAADPQR